jgi:hypothetical protein
VRGLNDPAKRSAVRNFVASLHVNIVCFQETKLDVVDDFVVMCNTPYILKCAELWAVVSGLGPADQPYSRMDKYTQEDTTGGMKKMTEV